MSDYSKTTGIVLPFPYEFDDNDYHQLHPFFIELFDLIPNEIELTVICNSDKAFLTMAALVKRPINTIIVIYDFQEIWLRDFMGIRVNNKTFLPQFDTTSMRTTHSPNYLTKVRKQIKSVFSKIGLAYQEIDINIDGGNFVTNDKIAIITERAILDNQNIDVREYIKGNLNIEPIFIKNSDDDLLCHSDGEVSFINEKTIIHSSYPIELSSLTEERLLLSANQTKLIENGFNIINIYDRPINGREIYNDLHLYSARGIYINNIILNNTVILPEFNIPSYKRTINYNKINKAIYENLGFKVKTINCDDLGFLGGGLHCVSWQY